MIYAPEEQSVRAHASLVTVEELMTSRSGRTVRTSQSQGNYVPVAGGDISVPDPSTRQMLRVECATNAVLGMTRSGLAGA